MNPSAQTFFYSVHLPLVGEKAWEQVKAGQLSKWPKPFYRSETEVTFSHRPNAQPLLFIFSLKSSDSRQGEDERTGVMPCERGWDMLVPKCCVFVFLVEIFFLR